MADTWRENAIVQAIQIIADKKIAQAGYDKTYKGIINRVLDQTSGKYEIKYQDSIFEAYATSSEVYYEEGQEVSFLVPGNDWDRIKTIIGGIANSALTYNQIQEISEKYNSIGPSAVSGRINLCSYRYQFRDVTEDEISINQENIENYVKNGNGLVLGMNVQTNLDSSQVGGDYGLVFNLRFKNNVNGDAAVRPYVVSAKDVIGNPYALTKQTKVERLFQDVDLENFEGIQSIQVFCEKFPQDQSITKADIFISNIRLNGVEVLSEDDLNGYSVYIDYSQTGNILDEDINTVTLNGILKVKGKTISQNVNYYWFRQNGMVLRGHEKYSNYGGDGWECLNNFANGKAIPLENNDIRFTTGESSSSPLTIQAVDRNTKVKCVAVFDYKITEGTSSVIDKIITTDIYIDSSDKRQGVEDNKVDYYLDAGCPTLTCVVDGSQDVVSGLEYHWTVVPARGKAESIESSQTSRESYLENKSEWDRVVSYANSLAAADAETYKETAEYTNAKENFEQVQSAPYVYQNVYYNFPINTISDYSKIICTITQDSNYKGSASITLYNHMQVPDTYTLNIENGTQVFQYDGKGNSPASAQLEKPIQILPLTFTLIDDEGNEVSYDQIINNGYVEWLLPNSNTLLASNDTANGSPLDPTTLIGTDKALAASFDIYKDIPSFTYTIAENYDSKKINNYIRLDIKYKDMLFSAYTDFTFPKDGDPGTNGTDYVIKLTPSTSTDRVYISNKATNVLFDDDGNTVDRLNFQVYNNSRKIENQTPALWTCPPKGTSADTTRGNTYINSYTNGVIVAKNISSDTVLTDKPINIVRAHYKNGVLNQYAEYPICYNYLVSNNGYRFKIKPKTGFKYAVYQEDGTSPQYDNTLPFEVIVELRNSSTGYYVVQDTGLTYSWDAIGNIELDDSRNMGLPINQRYYKPKNTFDGSDLTSAIVVKIYKNNSNIGYIHVPIYMIINRYGHSALNNWDGNSIQLNANGDTILAPQIGAGSKDSNNRFTGIFMGDVKDNSGNEDIGLMGYHQGQRSIFLDAQTGNATFGKQGAAQIKITASSGEGTIQSGDYNYNTSDHTGTGMKIKFSSTGSGTEQGPYIRYGSNKFSVSADGSIHAAGTGDIAGWNINDDALYKHDGTNKTGMRSGSDPAFYAGTNAQSNITPSSTAAYNFFVNHNGYLYSKSGQIAKWSIDSNALTDGNVGMGQGKTITANTFYNQSSAITDARIWSGTGTGTGAVTFAVDSNGKLWSKSGQIGPWALTQNQLTDGNTGLGTKTISATNMNSAFGVNASKAARIWSLGTNGSDSTANFVVTNTGQMYSKTGKIGGWNISESSLYAVSNTSNTTGIRLNANGSMNGGAGYNSSTGAGGSWSINTDGSSSFTNVTTDYMTATNATVTGNLTATTLTANQSGTIGGWTIGSSSLSANNITISSNGSISGSDWSISASGDAHFNNLYGTIKSGQSLSSTGGSGSWSMPGGGGSPSWNYGGYTMSPTKIKSFTTLKLKTRAMDQTNWKIVKETVPIGQCISITTDGTQSIQGTISGSTSEGQSISGTCTISVPKYKISIDQNYSLIKSTNYIGSQVVVGWHSDTKVTEHQVMSSPIPDAETGESS